MERRESSEAGGPKIVGPRARATDSRRLRDGQGQDTFWTLIRDGGVSVLYLSRAQAHPRIRVGKERCAVYSVEVQRKPSGEYVVVNGDPEIVANVEALIAPLTGEPREIVDATVVNFLDEYEDYVNGDLDVE